MYPFERFTEGARQALLAAQQEAVAANQPYIGTEHIALALARDDGAGGRLLRELGLTHEGLRAEVATVLATAEHRAQPRIIPVSRVKRVMEAAFQEATSAGAEQVGTEHLLVALLVEAEGVAAQALDALGATLPRVRRAMRAAREDRAAERPGILDSMTVGQATGSASVPGAPVGTSSSLGVALLRAGRLAREEGITDIRADHLMRAIAAADAADLRGTLARLGLTPEAVLAALTVPEEVRRLGLAAERARVEQAPAFASGGEAATRATAEVIRLGREHAEAVARWLGEGGGP